MKPETRTLRTVDLKLGPGRETLRVTLTRRGNGESEALVLAPGFGGADTDTPFHRPGWTSSPLSLPASIIPDLRDALDALEAES